MTAPAVSVIMAAYNGADVIGETVASLQAQTLADFEAVIVDDCSTDDTLALLQSLDDPRFRILRAERNGGPVRARNLALSHARGRFIAGLDQDDICLPNRFARQVRYLSDHPETVLVGATAGLFDGASARPSGLPAHTTPALIEWLLDIINPLVWSSVMLRADAAEQLDPFTRPDRLYAEDFDLYHRLRPIGRIARIDEELMLYRCHSGQASRRHVEIMYASAVRILSERHRPIFGDETDERCARLVRHVMGREPVPDRATLTQLGNTITRLQQRFLESEQPSREDRKLIRWETAKIWGQIGRASVRSGTLGLADTIAVRPDHLGMGYAGLDSLALSQAIGGVRSLLKKRA